MQEKQEEKGEFDKWMSLLSLDEETRSYMQELSRLYEIIYDELRNLLKKCLEGRGGQDIKAKIVEQRARLRKILKGLTKQRDPFVGCMQKVSFLKQYTSELEALDKILAVTLRLEKNKEQTKQKVINKAYSAISLGREISRSQYSLKKQIKQSERRCLRARSGTKLNDILQEDITGKIAQEYQPQEKSETFEQMLSKFKTKRKELQYLLQQAISRPNRCEVTFQKKYENLPAYFQKRLQFTNFFMGEDYIRNAKQQKKMAPLEPTENIQQPSPFLTEFNIKTKSLKPNIRKKIDEAIRQVKVRLIQQFHANRTNKFMEINTEQHIQLVRGQGQRLKSAERCETSASLHRSLNKWTRETGRSGSTRVSTANISRPSTRHYRQNIPIEDDEVDQRLLQRIKRSTYR